MKYRTGIPNGEKNYITPAGLKKFQDEFQQLKYNERPKVVEVVSWAAGNGDRSENGDYIYGKKRLREIDKRLEFLCKRLDIAELVDPLLITVDYVAIGATVTIVDDSGLEKVYQIVGADESDPNVGKISWVSPIARALLKTKEGDYVTYKSPGGERGLEVVSIKYVEIF